MTLKHLTNAAALLSMLALGTANAVEAVSARRITHIGCHHVNGACYVRLDGAAFGAAENCAAAPAGANEFRFDADTTDGRRTYASLLAALLNQRPVSVKIRS
jgi:hypothetical protein